MASAARYMIDSGRRGPARGAFAPGDRRRRRTRALRPRGFTTTIGDYASRRLRTANGSWGSATYTYDAFGRRVVRQVTAANAIDHYVFDPDGYLLADYNGATGTVLREYVWIIVCNYLIFGTDIGEHEVKIKKIIGMYMWAKNVVNALTMSHVECPNCHAQLDL